MTERTYGYCPDLNTHQNWGITVNQTNQAAADIMEILLGLPSPRHAAAAIATVRANLFIGGGATSVDAVTKMMNDDDKAAYEIWQTIAAATHQ